MGRTWSRLREGRTGPWDNILVMADRAPALRYRKFRDEDLQILSPWLVAAGLGVPPGVSREQWGRRLREDARIVCRAGTGRDHQVVGFFRLDLAPDNTAEITLIVAPGRRRQGFGRALLEASLAEARRIGLRRLIAVVDVANQAACTFFQDAGFERSGRPMEGYVLLERMVHRADHKPPIEIVT